MKGTPENGPTLSSGAKDRLRRVIQETVEAMPKAPVAELTAWTRKHHRALTKEFHEQWINAGLSSLFRAELQRQRPMKHGRPGLHHPQQIKLPGCEHIPMQFSVEHGTHDKPGRRVRFFQADVTDLKARLDLIQGEFTAEAGQLRDLIALMEPYDRAQPGIKVAKALELHGLKKPARGRRA